MTIANLEPSTHDHIAIDVDRLHIVLKHVANAADNTRKCVHIHLEVVEQELDN
jgi:hypothetical protein